MLMAYTDSAQRPDVALELPTGTGKTLTGLLIAEWNRHSHSERVLYACPTRQLAKQVRDAAARTGIDVALLTGPHTRWDADAQGRYEAAQRIGVTTYSSIFNSNPRLAPPSVVLFDDAHAGEQYVGEAYSISLDRSKEADAYQAVLDVVAPALDDMFLKRLGSVDPDPRIASEVRMVLPLRQPGMVDALDTVLSGLGEPHSFRYAMIRQALPSCLVYLSYSGLLIRPYIPPTHWNSLFEEARQRVYLSATLGEGGELERAFGRSRIERLCQPDESTAPRSGRRFFVFPKFVAGSDPMSLSRDVVAEAGKALVLSQRTDVAVEDAELLAQDGWPVLGIQDVDTGMGPFIESEHAVCALAGRYDGLDLPGDACRLVVLDGTPDRLSLQERFLQDNVQAGIALQARVRARITQGAGRCTRGPEDTAVVLVLGDLSGFLVRPETVSALAPELQAEIRFGLEHSQDSTRASVLENVRAFLSQDTDDTWRTQAEPTVIEYRHEAVQSPSPGAQQLSECAGRETDAWAAASAGSWRKAASYAHEVGSILGDGGRATRRYQAFWKYLEAAWTDMAAQDNSSDPTTGARTNRLLDDAAKLAGRGSWVHQMARFPDGHALATSHVDNSAARKVAAMLQGRPNEKKLRERLSRMRDGLEERDPGRFEPALSDLGKLLGADASKPKKQGRCDSVWCWDNNLWLALEAKSDHEPTGPVPVKDLRQANGQLKLLAEDRACPDVPPDSATVIISPKPGIHHDAVTIADSSVFLTHPDTIRDIAADTESAWETLLAERVDDAPADDLHALVVRTLRGLGVLPSDLRSRLTRNPASQAT